MDDLTYTPVAHDHDAFMERARRRPGFDKAYEELEAEYALIHELLAARVRAGMTQEQVAERMGTTKSAVSRLEAGGSHSPSVSTLERCARAVGCGVEIRLIPVSRAHAATGRVTRSGG